MRLGFCVSRRVYFEEIMVSSGWNQSLWTRREKEMVHVPGNKSWLDGMRTQLMPAWRLLVVDLTLSFDVLLLLILAPDNDADERRKRRSMREIVERVVRTETIYTFIDIVDIIYLLKIYIDIIAMNVNFIY